jgi:hypothetical protein
MHSYLKEQRHMQCQIDEFQNTWLQIIASGKSLFLLVKKLSAKMIF